MGGVVLCIEVVDIELDIIGCDIEIEDKVFEW